MHEGFGDGLSMACGTEFLARRMHNTYGTKLALDSFVNPPAVIQRARFLSDHLLPHRVQPGWNRLYSVRLPLIEAYHLHSFAK